MNNIDIRVEATKRGVKLWQIAEKLGITDASFSRKLRRELPYDEQRNVLGIIDAIAKEAENASN